MKKLFTLLYLSLVLFSCHSAAEEVNASAEAKKKIFSEVFNEKNIGSQSFEINPLRDTLLLGKKGTRVRIYANTFESEKGNSITGAVTIELKEALSPADFVLGNLTTTSKEGFLQSGGMVYINATSGKNKLKISDDKEIGFFVPADSVNENMSIYEGQKNDSSIVWNNPVPIANQEAKRLEQSYKVVWYREKSYTGEDITSSSEKVLGPEYDALTNWFFYREDRQKGDTFHLKNYYVEITNYTKDSVAMRESGSGLFIQEVVKRKGENHFISDYNTDYIFSVKKLGWANIDRLYDDPRSAPMNLIVTVSNEAEFDYVYSTMILPKEKMHIPGYQRKDSNFGFTHDDSEELVLPIGAEVTLFLTAYQGETPYFFIRKIVLKKDQKISCELQASKPEDFKKKIEEGL